MGFYGLSEIQFCLIKIILSFILFFSKAIISPKILPAKFNGTSRSFFLKHDFRQINLSIITHFLLTK